MDSLLLELQTLCDKAMEKIGYLKEENKILRKQLKVVERQRNEAIAVAQKLIDLVNANNKDREELVKMIRDSQGLCSEAIKQRDSALEKQGGFNIDHFGDN